MIDHFSEIAVFGPQPTAEDNDQPFQLGLLVACYNEEENITATLDTVVAACRDVGVSFQVVVIDDCSRDRSVEKVKEFGRLHPDVPLTLCIG